MESNIDNCPNNDIGLVFKTNLLDTSPTTISYIKFEEDSTFTATAKKKKYKLIFSTKKLIDDTFYLGISYTYSEESNNE